MCEPSLTGSARCPWDVGNQAWFFARAWWSSGSAARPSSAHPQQASPRQPGVSRAMSPSESWAARQAKTAMGGRPRPRPVRNTRAAHSARQPCLLRRNTRTADACVLWLNRRSSSGDKRSLASCLENLLHHPISGAKQPRGFDAPPMSCATRDVRRALTARPSGPLTGASIHFIHLGEQMAREAKHAMAV